MCEKLTRGLTDHTVTKYKVRNHEDYRFRTEIALDASTYHKLAVASMKVAAGLTCGVISRTKKHSKERENTAECAVHRLCPDRCTEQSARKNQSFILCRILLC